MNDLGVTIAETPKGLVGHPVVPAAKEEAQNVVDPLCIKNDAEEKLKDLQVPEKEAEENLEEETSEVTEIVEDCDENAKEKIEIDNEKVEVTDNIILDLESERIKEELLKDDNSSIDSTALEDIKTIETTSESDSIIPMETEDSEPTEAITNEEELLVEEKRSKDVVVPTKVIEEVTAVTPPVLETKETKPILQKETSPIKEVEPTTEPEPTDKPEEIPAEEEVIKDIKIEAEKAEVKSVDAEMLEFPAVPEAAPKVETKVEPAVVAVEKLEFQEITKPEIQEMPKPEVKPVNGELSKEHQPIKRRSSEELETESPLKKLCQEVEKTFPQHDTMINQYIETATKNNVDEIQRHTEQLLSEIQTLRELAQKKEHEWNNILHLKKVKEEILLRLLRRKQVVSFEKSPEVNGSGKDPFDFMTSRSLAIDKSDEISGLALKPPTSSPSMNIAPHPSPIIQPPPMPVTSQYNPMAGLPPPYDKAAHMQMARPVFPQSMMMPGPTMPFPRDMNGQMGQFGLPMGRQGPTKDVKSIIADYRQRNPEVAPRRGRRLRSILNPNMMNIPRQIAPKMDQLNNLGMIFNNLDMSQKAMLERLSQMQASGLPNGMSFKDVLVQFASIQQQSSGLIPPRPERPEPMPRPDPPRPETRRRPERPQHDEAHVSVKQAERPSAPSPRLPPPPPYPEISLLPVTAAGGQEGSSLLHGILTKPSPPAPQFSPTLAKLLTSPERQQGATLPTFGQAKNCGEITITPVQPTPPPADAPPPDKTEEVVQLDDEESPASSSSSDSASGRLVIDGAAPAAGSDTPLCQGCRRRDAQFVCAGCANQWYCSRDCQVAAWDDHSEMCSG